MFLWLKIACSDFSRLPHYFEHAAGEKRGFRPLLKPDAPPANASPI
jgi:hypothetical protein